MTQEKKEKLKELLYQAKFITNKEVNDPFVGIYFDSLVELMDDNKNGKL